MVLPSHETLLSSACLLLCFRCRCTFFVGSACFRFLSVLLLDFDVASVLSLHTPWLAAAISTYVLWRYAVCPCDVFRYASRCVCASLVVCLLSLRVVRWFRVLSSLHVPSLRSLLRHSYYRGAGFFSYTLHGWRPEHERMSFHCHIFLSLSTNTHTCKMTTHM